ncbi:aromatic ring-hydroxylating oxygenase subunit alpha [Amphiplicatus metriothermophilus]|uniref:Phenylpropionate dioxygenase, large terminal subunit n=1 Tax=Amphiplicatus metriothermophilus TaxID=1519374 RepID=A0A239PM76_9PROT|nr:aromatic ring-hydroxylating dioxygenase subunit alpha [Amphiplicatus metriothermophilus]MBB5517461.1 phenylpropionate dioxygenase-like ring-hydroxylating dioxygenase large terminal subunit [Amphiplicatus metriothermophilus]SNT68204.1 Phenylpropionate dioxygenase, large terminal subunit [Amphiplicatus metriothermophilus]
MTGARHPAPREEPPPLTGLWYLAAPSRDLPRGAMRRRILFGEPVVLGRTKAGAPFALRDVCPHRGAPLSYGRLRETGGETLVECPYHGWRFRVADGACAAIPALCGEDGAPGKIRTRAFRLHEENGLVWLYRDEEARAPRQSAPPAPDFGLDARLRPRVVARAGAEGPFDEAVIGLVDPAHTPFVHRQWWWRAGAALREKRKAFEPTPLGFKMPAHAPSSNSRIYRFLGGAPTTEIEFRLPSIRIETIRTAHNTIVGLTAITPTEPGKASILHVMFWDWPLLDLARPVLARMARSFLAQDGAILRAQNENLARLGHRPLYVGDADEPAKWYLQLARAWRAREAAGGFVNPTAGGSLRWRT